MTDLNWLCAVAKYMFFAAPNVLSKLTLGSMHNGDPPPLAMEHTVQAPLSVSNLNAGIEQKPLALNGNYIAKTAALRVGKRWIVKKRLGIRDHIGITHFQKTRNLVS
jgi:hypothetical protein